MALTQDSIKCCTGDLSMGQDKKTGLSESSSADSGAESDRVDGGWSIERQTACLNRADDTDGDHHGEDKDSKQFEGQRTEDDASKNDSETNRQMEEEVCKNIQIRDSLGSISLEEDDIGPKENAVEIPKSRITLVGKTKGTSQVADEDIEKENPDSTNIINLPDTHNKAAAFEIVPEKSDEENSKRSNLYQEKSQTEGPMDDEKENFKKNELNENASYTDNIPVGDEPEIEAIEKYTKDANKLANNNIPVIKNPHQNLAHKCVVKRMETILEISTEEERSEEVENVPEFSSDGIDQELEEPELELLKEPEPDLELQEEPNTKLLKYGKRKQKFTIVILTWHVCSLVIFILLLCRGESIVHKLFPKSLGYEDVTLSKVPYNISGPCDICVCAVGFHGPTFVPADNGTEEPPDIPPADLNRNGIEHVNITGDNNTNVANPVSEEPAMCNLNDANSSSIAGDNIYDDSGNYINVRDSHLDITVRQQSRHSTVPLPPLRNISSQYQSTFDAISVVQENYMPHFAYTGTSCTVANERFPFGEVRSRPFQDGRSTAAAVSRRETTHNQEFNQEGTRPQSDDVEIQSYLFNLTQFNSPYDIPPGLSDRNNRANTFRYLPWPHAYPAPQQMADAGFFYTGIRDVTQCFYCGNCIDDWNPGEDPFIEHRNLYPECNYVIVHSENRAPTNSQHGAIEATGISHEHGIEDPVYHQDTERERRWRRDTEPQWLQIFQQEPQQPDLHLHGEQNRSYNERFRFSLAPEEILFGPHRSQESSGIQETCGSQNVSSQTEGPSLVNDEIEEAVSRQQRRSPPDRRSVSLRIQPEFHVEATDQSHQPGNTPAGRPTRIHVNPSSQRVRPTERIRRPRDIEGILDSQVGRLVLYEGFSRRNVAEAVENILRDDGVVTYHSILMALVALGARLRRRRGVRPC